MPAPAKKVPVESAIQESICSQASGPLMAVRTRRANVTTPARMTERRVPQRIPAASATNRYTNQNATTEWRQDQKDGERSQIEREAGSGTSPIHFTFWITARTRDTNR